MGDREAAAILAFPASRPALRTSADSGDRRGVVLSLRTVDESHDDDLAFSPEWDEMSKLATKLRMNAVPGKGKRYCGGAAPRMTAPD
jgi:hypothetical protein